MTNQTTTPTFEEAPASWNTRYVTPDGFTCQLTLRADNGKDLLERANSALAHLREQDCIPFYGYNNNGYGNQNNDKESNGANSNCENVCPIHNVEMKQWKKNGKVWYSHNVDGEWCYGK